MGTEGRFAGRAVRPGREREKEEGEEMERERWTGGRRKKSRARDGEREGEHRFAKTKLHQTLSVTVWVTECHLMIVEVKSLNN